MAFFAISLFARFKSLLAIVADPAALTLIHLSHCNLCPFLHRKDLCMAVRAFQSLVRMGFSVKDDLALGSSCVLYCLPEETARPLPANAIIIIRIRIHS